MYFHLAAIFLTFLLTTVLSAPTCGLAPPPKDTNVSSTSSSTTGCSNLAAADALLTGWYPGWLGNQSPPQNISWSKYTALTFAFGVTTPNGGVSLDDISTQVLPEFVASAKEHNVQALLSIGGWTGSRYFSSAVATQESRTAFVKTIVDLVNQYDLDGIDFDWEYPNKQGIGCNQQSPDDAANFLSFLEQLRSDPVGSKLTLSAAVGIAPFVGSDGVPMTDVSGFAKVLDHIGIMNYDVWGSWSPSVGPNAPLDDTCAPTKAGSAVSAVKAWTDAGFPADQIALGVAAYGHSFHVAQTAALNAQSNTLQLYPAFDKALQPHGDSQDGEAGVDQCGNPVPVGGIFNFWGLVDGGFLNQDGTADTQAGIVYRYDNCSQTPYVYNPTNQVMVSYDDATSFAVKGKWINENGLKGFAMWHVLGDFDDILLDAISEAMGVDVEPCSA
ncbi:glycoside hydrolase family 18 protein [Moniliophthora roreri MCA 2997]|uniref:Glycoside hydrolase family 18 protein n=1 Tax=Moniliophthora roreri (strain MCA 2997) TaxID=1381753 RepID=V2XAS2_MONRO|nr:glycoside hydrolase family 18 protein [Moniliophthora roreri MCA 2997]